EKTDRRRDGRRRGTDLDTFTTMTFLQRFIKAWRDAKLNCKYEPLADEDGAWTEDDAKRLSEYFASDSGRRLKLRLMNYVVRCAVQATQMETNLERHAGIARGIALCVGAIETHFAREPRSVHIPEVAPVEDAMADLEHL